MRLLIHVLLGMLSAACSPPNDNSVQSYTGIGHISKNTFDNYLQFKMEDLKIPGLSVAIINNGKIVHHKALGYADVEKKQPVTLQTIFEGASLSKSVFAFFVMKYVEEGKLDLDKPLYEYLPYSDIAYDDRYKKITARMVLSHRSGFPNWRRDEADDNLRIKFDPGEDYLYSGEGYQYLAMVLGHIEGTDWNGLEAAFQNKVARPIGLQHTVFIQTPYTRQYKATPYNEEGQRIDLQDDEIFGAAYSIHSEPLDFSKWIIAVMNKEELSEESYAELFKPHSKVPSEAIDLSYCLGFFNPHFPIIGSDIFFHTGNNVGFTSWYAFDLEKGWGFVMFTNSEFGEKLGEDLFFYLLLGPYFPYVAIATLLIILIGIGYIGTFVVRLIKRKRMNIAD